MSHFDDDDALERILGKSLALDQQVPPEWREAARAAYTWRTIDAELLALTHDSAVEAGAAVRGPGEARTVAFTGGGMTLEVELSDRQIMGQLTAPGGSEVVFESVDGRTRSTSIDDSGFFSLPGEDHGLVRFAVRPEGGARLVTQWIVL